MQEGKAQAGLWADSPSFTVAAHELKAPLALIRQLAIELEAGEYTALERAVLAQRITLTAERALRLTSVAISVRATDSNQRVRIGVRDFGPAIPARAWRALRQGLREPLPLHNRPGSSGLGMFIANEFALAIGAQIGVIRHRDGATFYVDVPASTQLRLL